MCVRERTGISATPGESEPRRQGGILGLENNADLMGGGCKWSNTRFLKKQKEEKLSCLLSLSIIVLNLQR